MSVIRSIRLQCKTKAFDWFTTFKSLFRAELLQPKVEWRELGNFEQFIEFYNCRSIPPIYILS
eukprot:scaffold1605_cov170-Ochromonas_danica.AAC.2